MGGMGVGPQAGGMPPGTPKQWGLSTDVPSVSGAKHPAAACVAGDAATTTAAVEQKAMAVAAVIDASERLFTRMLVAGRSRRKCIWSPGEVDDMVG
jgi:hypothetical protein